MKNILNIFAKSPIKPLQAHATKINESCELLNLFVDAILEEDWDKADELYDGISEKEREADLLKREIRLNLPKGIFLPVARTDLLDLVTQLDKLANYAQDVASRILIRKLVIPKELKVLFNEFVETAIEGVEQAVSTVHRIDYLLEAGFHGKEADLVFEMVNKLDDIEDANDILKSKLREEFLKVERNYYAVDVMVVYKIIDRIGILAEQSQRVGSRIELIIASN